jgi:sugar phosphate isomerase/epimerase
MGAYLGGIQDACRDCGHVPQQEIHMTKFTLMGNNGYTVQDHPDPHEWIRPLAEAGLRHMEFYVDHLDPLYYENVIQNRTAFFQATVEVLQEHQIRVVSVGTGKLIYLCNGLSHPYPDMAAEGMRWCKGMVDLAIALGARFIAGHYDYMTLSDLADRRDDSLRRLIAGLIELSRYAEEKGLEAICLEQMYLPSLKPYTIQEGKTLIEELNSKSSIPFYIHLDTGHMAVGPNDGVHTDEDKDPYRWLSENYGGMPRMFVHLQQTDKEASRHWPFTAEYNEKGFIDGRKVIEAIEESGVEEAFLALEILYPRATPLDAITPDIVESVRYFDNILTGMGYSGENDVYVKA